MYQHKSYCFASYTNAKKMFVAHNCPTITADGTLIPCRDNFFHVYKHVDGNWQSISTRTQGSKLTFPTFPECDIQTEQLLDFTSLAFMLLVTAFGYSLIRRATNK